MSRFLIGIITLILSSCCTPYYATDPLYLNRIEQTSDCPLQPCKDTDENCSGAPWLNIEYDYGNQQTLKIGQYIHGYAQNFMISGGINWTLQEKGGNGLGLDVQIGFLERKNFYTLFSGVEYIRLNEKGNSQIISPSIAYTFPYKYLSAFQLKTGYNIALENQKYGGPFVAIKTQIPLSLFF